MAIIIRAGFNNQGWSGKCKNAKNDTKLFKCQGGKLNTGFSVDKYGNCRADCWESTLCKNFCWTNDKGNFNREKAKGHAFFTFSDFDNSLILWGTSEINRVEEDIIYFNRFKPMPINNWVKFSSQDLFGSVWKRLTFRYLNDTEAAILDEMMSNYFHDPAETDISDIEGKKKLRQHLITERSTKLIKAFKKSLLSFDCQICGFNFKERYGEIGANFIEAHHTKPVASFTQPEKVSINDLVAVCSNCHRILHKTNTLMEWSELQKFIKSSSG